MSLRTRPPGQWSLKDTYGFIANYVEAHAQMPAYAQKRPVIRPAYSPSSQGLPAARPMVTNRKTRATAAGASSSEHQQSPHNGPSSVPASHAARRDFHNYFVTHLPSSSMHPDSRVSMGSHHKLPRSAATRHVPSPGSLPAAAPPNLSSGRDMTVVRIPLRSAKHHFGVGESRGQRPYNEDTYQAGTIDMPAFAKRPPISLVRSAMKRSGEGTSADSVFGDPQVFYYAVFDGHGGTQCSDFLRGELHGYIEEAANEFELKSSVKSLKRRQASATGQDSERAKAPASPDGQVGSAEDLIKPDIKEADQVSKDGIPRANEDGMIQEVEKADAVAGSQPKPMNANVPKAIRLQEELVKEYKATVGGYFRRFNPPHFTLGREEQTPKPMVSIETVLTYAFLRADLDFITAQARKPDPDDPYVSDSALNDNEILGSPSHMPPLGHGLGGGERFKGGSTASVALISTPTPSPYWHPAATSTLLVGHVGDSRVLLCETSTGLAVPLTSDHHPSSPGEAQRLRRYAASFVTDSFGEERIQGLANSRAFGDMGSKRLGVSAEPEITRTEMGPAQYSFLVLMSDGVSGTLSDQEIVDIVKEAKTPEQGSRDVVSYATEVTNNGDNATCLVVRLGGWERRSEGGLGSLGTKEIRDFRRNEANDPRRGRR